MSVHICGAHILIIVNHAPPPESYFSLLSIVNRRSFPHPPEVGARYSLYVQMYTIGCCVEKHRCHSCGAHGNGKTLLAQVLPCGMTKTFVKLRSLPETSIFNAASVKRFYISQRRTDKKLPSCMFPPTHKQFGCRSCGSSKVGCLGLPHSVPWWPVALATRHTLWIGRPRYYNGPNQPATTDIAQLLRRSNALSRMVRSKRTASHKIFSATSEAAIPGARRH